MSAPREAAKKGRAERSVVRVAFNLTLGPFIWAAHLAVVYGVHSFGCARDLFGSGLFGLDQPRLLIAGATVLAVLGIAAGVPLWAPGRSTEQEPGFERGVAIGLAGLSVFGVLAAGAAAIIIPACAPLR
jgi:hypothetical protein